MATRTPTRDTAAASPPKLGLALSGGGLRASFFHIGVLAQMARQGLLRHVEVISAVSGGSIIAALYYLHLKRLLESTPDDRIDDADYVRILQTIEADFLKAVEKNLRMRTFSSFAANWKMRQPDYSRSDRMAELYDQLIYQTAFPREGGRPIEMRELKIFPPGQPQFHPRRDNVVRGAKVPILLLNATTLNTGRNWHFNAQSMGEPIRYDANGQPIHGEADTKPLRLRRAESYAGMVTRQQKSPLGHGVAASACVPGLFHPLAISELYRDGEEDIRVQLVDGGVHDNQGIGALLYEECTRFVISDSSGPMAVDDQPDTGPAPVLLRTAGILQDRVRSESLVRLFETHGRERVAFMHLRKGMAIRELAWIDAAGQPAAPEQTHGPTTDQFGVDPVVQDCLGAIRTDLDAFTEVEAYSLMLDGYLMSDAELAKFRKKSRYPEARLAAAEAESPWRFLQIKPWVEKPGQGDYLHQLQVARYLFGKALLLIPALLVVSLLLVAAVIVLLWPTLLQWLSGSIPVLAIVLALAVFLLDFLGGKLAQLNQLRKLAGLIKSLKALRTPLELYRAGKRLLFRALGPLLGTVFIKLYLVLVNPLFVERGRLAALKKRDPR